MAALLRRQHGRVTWAQLRGLGAPEATISQWARNGRLIKVLPKVYAVGHDIPTPEARQWEAVLYAGPGAMLSHRSAAHRLDLIRYPPPVIEVSTPLKRRSIPGTVRVYANRGITRTVHRGLPTTTIPQTVLDLAAVRPDLLRRALAQLDYQHHLDIKALEAMCGKGRRGATALRQALATHEPELANAKEGLETTFLLWCERHRLPIPRCNSRLHGFEVDAYWPQYSLVVELDGADAHSSPAQIRSDRKRDLTLRAHGITVLRYDTNLMKTAAPEMYADLTAHMKPPT